MHKMLVSIVSVPCLVFAIASPAAGTTTFKNTAFVTSLDLSNFNIFFQSDITKLDGSPATNSGFNNDGFASAQATKENNGTAIATASGQNFYYEGASSTIFNSTFDFSPSTKGKITIKLTGWAIANGNGVASIESFILLNNSIVDFRKAYSSEYLNPKPGLQKLSLVKTFYWKGGDTINITNRARAQVYGSSLGPQGAGFASAYVDPIISIGNVPEPASWAMLIAGFGLTGAAMRRRRVVAAI